MPIYEYRCGSCSHELDALQKLSDSPLRKCPACGRLTLRRLISAPVFRLKGGGWYETDFKGDKENKRNLAVDKEPDTSADAKPAAKGGAADAKADAKPAAEAKPAEAKASDTGSRKTSAVKSRPKSAPKAKAKKRKRR